MEISWHIALKSPPLDLFLFIFYYALVAKDLVVCPVVPTPVLEDLVIYPNIKEHFKSLHDGSIDSDVTYLFKGPEINNKSSVEVLLNTLYFPTPITFLSFEPTGKTPDASKVDDQGTVQKSGDGNKKFVIMIDAGSSGSRIFVYNYYFKKNPSSRYVSVEDLVIDLALDSRGNREPLTRRIYPGLSSYSTNSSMAAEYLFKLIDSVINLIPPQYLPETPLYILATAGLRLLSEEQRIAILEDCRRDISLRYPLLYFPQHHVAIISGEMEGVYAWISINYILGNFKKQHLSGTVGILDMGGASLQIAYEVPSNYNPRADSKNLIQSGVTDLFKLVDLSDYPLTDAVSKRWIYKLYVASFLGYGANEAINTYHQGILDRFVYDLKAARFVSGSNKRGIKGTTLPKLPIRDPCYPKGLAYNLTGTFKVPIKVGQQMREKSYAVTLPVLGTGDFVECQKAMLPLLNLQKACLVKPCSFNGFHRPPKAYPNAKFYGVSEFWYTSQSIEAFLGPYISEVFESRAKGACKAKEEDTRLQSNNDDLDESRYVPKAGERCAKASWISIVLHRGFSFPAGDPKIAPIEFVSKIDGKDVQWTFGAAISEIFRDRKLKRI